MDVAGALSAPTPGEESPPVLGPATPDGEVSTEAETATERSADDILELILSLIHI